MVPKCRRKPDTPQIDPKDPFLLSPPQGFENYKCNTPGSHRRNLFDMAKNTVDRVKHNVRVKRQELINMVYSHAGDSDEETEDTVDK